MALQDIIWFVIFDGIWNTRNEILHKQENFYGQEQDSKLNRIIRWFVYHKHEVLRRGDQFLANIDLTRLQYMRRLTKKRWIEHAEKAKKMTDMERKQREKGQTTITSFFRVRARQVEPDLGLDPG